MDKDKKADDLDLLLGLNPGEADIEDEPDDEEDLGTSDEGDGQGEDEDSDGDGDESGEKVEEDAEGQGDPDKDDEKDDEEDEEDDEELTPSDSATKREKGLFREVTRLRQKLRAAPIAPPPSQTTAAPLTPTPPPKIHVVMSDDGKSFFVDPVALEEAIQTRARAIASEEARIANTPDPEAVRTYQLQKADSDFIAKNAGNKAIVDRANQIDEFVTLSIGNLLQQGYKFSNMEEVVSALEANGVDKQVGKFFPEIAPMFREFVVGRAKADPTWRTSIHERMAGRPAGLPRLPKKKVKVGAEVLKDTPRSMANRGGRDRRKLTTDDREFNELERQFEANPTALSDKKFERYKYLGKKLRKDGMDDL